MITWFQRVFGKHHKWILMAFLTVLLLSFIIGIGAVPRGSLTPGRKTQQLFLGTDLNDTEEMQNLRTAVIFTRERLFAQPVESSQELNLLFEQRIAQKYLADQWQIPPSTPQQIEDFVRTLPAFHNPDGAFSNDLYTLFRDEVQASPPDQRDQAAAILAEDCRLERVRQILGGPGYRLPGNVQTTLLQIQNAQDNFKYSLEAATMDLDKFEPKIETDEAKLNSDLQQIYIADPSKFEQPAQAQLSYVKFPAAAVPAPTAEELHAYATAHKEDYPGISTGSLTEKDWTAVAAAWRTEQKATAETAAKTAAMNFARELYNLQTAPDKPEFAAILKKYNLAPQSLPTLIQGQPAPADSPIPDDTLQQTAFDLNAEKYFAPVELPDGAGILILTQATPAHASTFPEARPAVLKAYTEQERAKQFSARGAEIGAAIAKDFAAGKSFRDAALAQNLTVKEFSDVSDTGLRDAAMEILNPSSKDATPTSPLAPLGRDLIDALVNPDTNGVPFLLTLQPGQVSRMMVGGGIGVIFHATKREPATIEVDSPEVKHQQEFMAQQEAAFNAGLSLTRLLQSAQAALKPAGS
jgi:hypothetical protein